MNAVRALLRMVSGVTAAGVCLWGQCSSPKYITPGTLPPGLQYAVARHGGHLVRPGKERLSATGAIERNKTGPASIALSIQSPGVIVLDQQGAGKAARISADAASVSTSNGSVTEDDQDLVGLLRDDSAEHFFSLISSQAPHRRLGTNVRLDSSVKGPYTGPVYDVYTAVDTVTVGGVSKKQSKVFFVNSRTFLLERIEYDSVFKQGAFVQVIVDNWLDVQGDRVPKTIRRLENGEEVLRIELSTATFAAAVAETGACSTSPEARK